MEKKHLALLSFFGIFVVCIAIFGTLNYKNYCLLNGKILSDKEKIHLIVADVNSRPKIRLEIPFVDTDGIKKEKLLHYKQIPYESVEDFLQKNPDCCEINQYKTIGNQPSSTSNFIGRVSGGYAGEAEIKYIAHYLDDNNLQKISKIKVWRRIDNCGYVDLD